MLVVDVLAYELDVLRDVGLRGADPRDALLDVVDEALGHGGVLVQVDQVGSLKQRQAGVTIHDMASENLTNESLRTLTGGVYPESVAGFTAMVTKRGSCQTTLSDRYLKYLNCGAQHQLKLNVAHDIKGIMSETDTTKCSVFKEYANRH